MNTSGGLLGDTVAVLEHLRVFLVNQTGQITTVVEDEVKLLPILEGDELLLETPIVFLVRFTLPSEAEIIVRTRTLL